MFKQTALMLILVSMLNFLCTGCAEKPAQIQVFSRENFIMDTVIRISVYSADPKLGQAALDAAFAEFSRIDRLADRFAESATHKAESSDVIRINLSAARVPVSVSEDTMVMLEKSVNIAALSEGAFDVTIAPVVDIWGFKDAEHQIPGGQELKEKLALVDYKRIRTDREQKTVFLPEDGTAVDLGGIAKGYATDMAVRELRRLGITSAMINAGGNVYALGAKPDGTLWRVGIQDPRDSEKIIAVLSVKDTAVVSSGDYERYFMLDGIRYHHILDPATGEPARKMISATVLNSSAADADALSTAVFVLGPERGAALIRELSATQAVFVDNEQTISYSRSLEEQIEFLDQEHYPLAADEESGGY